jgi:DNA-binding MarR family transcriptional regulator
MMHGCTIVKGSGRSVARVSPVDYFSGVPRGDHEFYESFGAVTRCLRSVAAQAYATFEVGSAQAKFLRHIGRHSRISQADLARATATAPTLTGRALETLVERGWVRRKRSEEDRREYVLELTPSGQRARERVEEARAGIIDRIAKALDERDVEDFDRIAKKILAEFEGSVAPEASLDLDAPARTKRSRKG